MMKLPIAGPAYKHPSQDVNFQRCLNMFPTISDPAKVQPNSNVYQQPQQSFQDQDLVLLPSPGVALLEDLGNEECRALGTISGVTYTVIGNTVYKLNVNTATLTATSTALGTIGTNTGTVNFDANPTQVLFVDGSSHGYTYMPANAGRATVGIFGGTAADTYSLTINGVAIYTAQNVAAALTLAQVVTQINTLTTTTGIRATGATGIITLAATDDRTITVVESGTGFVNGTDGITVTGGDFAAALPAFMQIADADFVGGTHVKFIGGYFIVNGPNTGELWFSGLNDGKSWDALDVGTAESSTDPIVALGSVKGELWVLGSDSIEIWYNAGNASGCPFSPRKSLAIKNGCGAAYAALEFNDLLTWMDDRGFIVQSSVSSFIRDNNSGYDLTIISDEAITAEILSYSTRSDAIACKYSDDRGHYLYQITFPSAKKTWAYDYTAKMWHEKAYYNSFTNELEHHLGQYATTNGYLHLTSGTRDGKIYISKSTYYTDNGVPIRRLRTTRPIKDSDTRGILFVDRLDLKAETGEANQNGDGSDPYILLRCSVDGGHTWSDYMARSFGKVGEYNKAINWNRLGYGRDWIFEFSLTEPIKFSLISATLNLDEEQ